MFGRNVAEQSSNREAVFVLIISSGTNVLIVEKIKVVFFTGSGVFSTTSLHSASKDRLGFCYRSSIRLGRFISVKM